MNKYQHIRKRKIHRWRASHPNLYKRKISLEILGAQEGLTKEIAQFCDEREQANPMTEGYGRHYHLCTYEMVSNDGRWQDAMCIKWREKHGMMGKNKYDCCDYCTMMNYVALDDEGKIMYVTRNIPDSET